MSSHRSMNINILYFFRLLAPPDTVSTTTGQSPKEQFTLAVAWRRVASFIARFLSSQAVVTPPTSEPLNFVHAIPQVGPTSHRLRGLQDALVYLHRSISKENARLRRDEEEVLSSWALWGKKDKERRLYEQSQNFLSVIDHRRKEGLAHLDAVDNSLRSYQLDALDISSSDSHRYQLFRLQHIVQRLGHQSIPLSHPGTRGTVNPLVTDAVEYID